MKTDSSTQFKQSTLLPWVELRLADNSSACYQAHSHDEFSFGVIDQGHANYVNSGRIQQITRGDIVTINPADVHSCNPRQGVWSYQMLFVDTIKMGEIQQDIFQCHNADYLAFEQDYSQASNLKRELLLLLEALKQGVDLLHTQSCLYEFVATAFDTCPQVKNTRLALSSNLNRIRQKLLDEVDGKHQLQQLADEAGISRYQLLRQFKQQYGLPPYAYLIDERIKRAKVMLRQGQAISEVALGLGFADQAHFQREFKKKLAATPKFYQSHFKPAS